MSKKSTWSKRISFLNARVTSTLSVSLVLFVLGIMALMGLLVNNLSHQVKENLGFTVVFHESVEDSTQIVPLLQTIRESNYVKEIRYISKEEALETVTRELGENPADVLDGYNPMRISLEVNVKSEYAHADSLATIEKALKAQEQVVEFHYHKDLVKSVNDNIARVGFVLLILAVVLMFISFALISNTIRLSVYSKRFLIHTMKLVGATSGFIRRPFIVANIVNGIVASIIAMLMLSGGVYYFTREMPDIGALITVFDMLMVFAVMTVLGIILTALSAYWAVSRYIRKDGDELYYI